MAAGLYSSAVFFRVLPEVRGSAKVSGGDAEARGLCSPPVVDGVAVAAVELAPFAEVSIRVVFQRG